MMNHLSGFPVPRYRPSRVRARARPTREMVEKAIDETAKHKTRALGSGGHVLGFVRARPRSLLNK